MDLSDIVTDPDFVTTFQVEVRIETVGTNGRASFDISVSDAAGVVVPDSESLGRQPDGSRLSGAIKVFTSHLLSSFTPERQGDVVIWNGARYTVMAISDFSRWDGLRVASCELIPYEK